MERKLKATLWCACSAISLVGVCDYGAQLVLLSRKQLVANTFKGTAGRTCSVTQRCCLTTNIVSFCFLFEGWIVDCLSTIAASLLCKQPLCSFGRGQGAVLISFRSLAVARGPQAGVHNLVSNFLYYITRCSCEHGFVWQGCGAVMSWSGFQLFCSVFVDFHLCCYIQLSGESCHS